MRDVAGYLRPPSGRFRKSPTATLVLIDEDPQQALNH